MLCDIQKSQGLLFNTRALRQTIGIVDKRTRSEGLSFLTKTLPRLAKALDRALCEHTAMNCHDVGFKPYRNGKLPIFMGEFFATVFDNQTGRVLPDPCATSVRTLREILYCFYKYNIPCAERLEQKVLSDFKKTEKDLERIGSKLSFVGALCTGFSNDHIIGKNTDMVSVTRRARRLLEKVFDGLDLTDITPKHGPGAVAGRQQLWNKYKWTNVSGRLRHTFPLMEYFCASPRHAVDSYRLLSSIKYEDLPARVLLVPKDSRGPRLISCEPVEFQWVQQGVMRAIVQHVERIDLTRFNVFFTNQRTNQLGALHGSSTGKLATLDLKEASDRVSVELVRLLFPKHVTDVLLAARSLSTTMPNGEVIRLEKFAPMGSGLCFPILALTIWAILTAATSDAYVQTHIAVYGDDVIVPTAFAADAIEQLQSFGLLCNPDKCCIKGFFRESCGVDAFKGHDVTPLRYRKAWSPSRSPETYASWISYANSLYVRKYHDSYDLVVGWLTRCYGSIPDKDMVSNTCPSLIEVPEQYRPKRYRINRHLQKRQWYVRASSRSH
jgi:hypothetical protein